jgi:hypothetical protein
MPICEPSKQPYHCGAICRSFFMLMLPISIFLTFAPAPIQNLSFFIADILCTRQIIEDSSFNKILPDLLHSSAFSVKFDIRI